MQNIRALFEHMRNVEMEIRPLEAQEFEAFFSYLNHHLSDNGRNGTPLFQPVSRNESRFPREKEAGFTEGLIVPVGEPKWRRAWIAVGEDEEIFAHIDLRAHPEPYTEHRALLGMGVRRDFRGKGLGKRLIEKIELWATNSTNIERIDLWVLSNNVPAIGLYKNSGYRKLGEVEDMFRIDGISEPYTLMSKCIA